MIISGMDLNRVSKNPIKRGHFIKAILSCFGLMGMGLGCKPSLIQGGSGSTSSGLSFGTSDIGLLNYLYVIEQVQYQFYLKLIQSGLFDKSTNTFGLLSDIVNHELTHTQFFQNVLGTNAIANLEFDFSSLNFTQKLTALATAEKFQNTEAQAYNGVLGYFQSSSILTLAGKIGVVESRHSAFISGLVNPGSFVLGSIVDPKGFEIGLSPSSVILFYKPYIKTLLDGSTLPSN